MLGQESSSRPESEGEAGERYGNSPETSNAQAGWTAPNAGGGE